MKTTLVVYILLMAILLEVFLVYATVQTWKTDNRFFRLMMVLTAILTMLLFVCMIVGVTMY